MVCRTHLWTFSGCFIGFATFKKLVPTIHNLLLVIKHIYQKNISWLVRDEDMVLDIAWFVIAAGLASMTMQIGKKKRTKPETSINDFGCIQVWEGYSILNIGLAVSIHTHTYIYIGIYRFRMEKPS